MGVETISPGFLGESANFVSQIGALINYLFREEDELGPLETAPGFVPNRAGAYEAERFLGQEFDPGRFDSITEGFAQDLLGGEFAFDPSFGGIKGISPGDIERSDIPDVPGLSPEETAQFFDRAVGAPARNALETYVLPGIRADFARRGALTGSFASQAQGRARNDLQIALDAELAKGQLSNQRLEAELNQQGAIAESGLNVGSSRLFSQLGLEGDIATQGFLSQQEQDRNVFGIQAAGQRSLQAGVGADFLAGFGDRQFNIQAQIQQLLQIPYQNQLGQAQARRSAFLTDAGLDAQAFAQLMETVNANPRQSFYVPDEGPSSGGAFGAGLSALGPVFGLSATAPGAVLTQLGI